MASYVYLVRYVAVDAIVDGADGPPARDHYKGDLGGDLLHAGNPTDVVRRVWPRHSAGRVNMDPSTSSRAKSCDWLLSSMAFASAFAFASASRRATDGIYNFCPVLDTRCNRWYGCVCVRFMCVLI